MTRLRTTLVFVAMTLTTAVGVIWLMSPMLPLGVPGEWGWATSAWTDAHPFAWISNLVVAAIGIGVIASLTRSLSPVREVSSTRRRRWTATGLTCVFACAWWVSLLNSIPAPYGLSRSPFVLYYPRMTGYYTAARYSNDRTRTFLRGYEQMLRDLKGTERYLHIGTHPPGLTLLNRGFLGMTAASPALVRFLAATMPEQIRDANETIAGESAASGREFTERDAATLWLIALLTIVSAAACIPLLASLLRAAGHSEASALRWSALWIFTPAVAVFLPKDDVLFAFPALLAAWLWVRALALDSRWRAFAAGVVCFGGLLSSLAFLPIVLWLIVATIWAWFREGHPHESSKTVKPRAGALAAGLAGFLVALFVFLTGFETNLPTIWRLNLENHAEFYQHNERSYGKWLIANVGELMFAAGPVVFVLAIAGGVLRWRPAESKTPWSMLGPAGLAVIAILWLSGKTMGEAARLWILFLPWLLLCVAPIEWKQTGAERRGTPTWLWWVAAGLQAVFCIAAATQIDGFGFSEL